MENYDDNIPASMLKIGDSLHLTFMGGDEYVTVKNVKVNDNGDITWNASYYAELTDTVKPDKVLRIRKKYGVKV